MVKIWAHESTAHLIRELTRRASAPTRADLDASAESGFLITGMPGAGQSTVARQLALRFDRAAHIDIDMVFHHFTVAGRVEAAHSTEERDRQSDLAVANAAAMARNYLGAGFACVLEGAVALRSQVQMCADIVAPSPLHLVVLAPPLAVSEQRDRERSGKHVAEVFRFLHPLIHQELHGLGLWLDSSALTPPQTVTAMP
jgi:predicted kinase